jgi:hypothetical protein
MDYPYPRNQEHPFPGTYGALRDEFLDTLIDSRPYLAYRVFGRKVYLPRLWGKSPRKALRRLLVLQFAMWEEQFDKDDETTPAEPAKPDYPPGRPTLHVPFPKPRVDQDS